MPAFLQPGRLDRRITIQRATVTFNDYNEPTEIWYDHATVWAAKHDVSAGESIRAAEVNAEITTRFIIRWSSVTSDVSPTDRIVYQTVIHNIIAVREVADTRNRWIEIDAVRRADVPMEEAEDSPEEEGDG